MTIYLTFRIYSQKKVSAEDVTQVLHILDRSGARNYTEAVTDQYYLQALKELELAGASPSAQLELKEVSAFLLGREGD